ncbi:MAG: imidazoleglycerol-phosphate dehydratase HisB [Deltaproteobacteria bacterium]|nr:imidazoleglycerol-phosphate dehydratase HisB [Deltaproteobacteria bacterium]
MSRPPVTLRRTTLETDVQVTLSLDGTGKADVSTGLGFLDHLLGSLARHARFDLSLTCKGDLHVDGHHSVEDCALAFGQALDRGLGERKGIARFGSAHAPLDEALARAVVDLSGRPYAVIELGLELPAIGTMTGQDVVHFFHSLAISSRSCIHLTVLAGANDHHRAEAAAKALALALRQAVTLDGGTEAPSTKGVL